MYNKYLESFSRILHMYNVGDIIQCPLDPVSINNGSRGYQYQYNHGCNELYDHDPKERENDAYLNEYYNDIKDEELRPHNIYSYIPRTGYRAQGFIKISRELTAHIIPQIIKENIANVWDFMDKSTGIALFHGNALHIANNVMVLNYGFHDKNGNALYLVADRNKTSEISYKMREILYTQQQICYMFAVREDVLPMSCVDINRENVTNVMIKINNIFRKLSSFYKNGYKNWHKLPHFHGINGKYNKKRFVLSLTKESFCAAINRFVCNKIPKLIPIVMFSSNGCRAEYIHIVKIANNTDIGISYIYDANNDMIKPTGIHLHKTSILYQHQLIAPNHRCHCLDDFQSNIDDLRIGNPDDDKNRLKDLKSRNQNLKQKNVQLSQLNTQLELENDKLKKQNQDMVNLLMNINICPVTVTPIPIPSSPVPLTPFISSPTPRNSSPVPVPLHRGIHGLSHINISPQIITEGQALSVNHYNNLPNSASTTVSSYSGSQFTFPFNN